MTIRTLYYTLRSFIFPYFTTMRTYKPIFFNYFSNKKSLVWKFKIKKYLIIFKKINCLMVSIDKMLKKIFISNSLFKTNKPLFCAIG